MSWHASQDKIVKALGAVGRLTRREGSNVIHIKYFLLVTLLNCVQETEGAYGRFLSADVVCHELAHQWFGDYVTCLDFDNIVGKLSSQSCLILFFWHPCLLPMFHFACTQIKVLL